MPAIPDTGLVATLDDLKAHLNITSSTPAQDDELTHVLIAVSELVAKIIGGPLAVTTITARYNTAGTVLIPSQRPLVSVVSATADWGGTVDASSYTVDTYGGTITGLYGTWGAGTLVYTAGLSQVPERVRLAGLIIAKHLWETQRGAGRPGDNDEFVPAAGFAIPRRAEELLQYDQIPGIA